MGKKEGYFSNENAAASGGLKIETTPHRHHTGAATAAAPRTVGHSDELFNTIEAIGGRK
jgi:hypothetical protein